MIQKATYHETFLTNTFLKIEATQTNLLNKIEEQSLKITTSNKSLFKQPSYSQINTAALCTINRNRKLFYAIHKQLF
jgi:hypothetical protein